MKVHTPIQTFIVSLIFGVVSTIALSLMIQNKTNAISKYKPTNYNRDISYGGKDYLTSFYEEYYTIDNKEELDNIIKMTVILNWVNDRLFKTVYINYPQYLQREYDIEKPDRIHNNLITSGYLKECSNSEKLIGLKIADLQEILKENNLNTQGIKEDLVNRIVSNDLNISSLDPFWMFKLTDKGSALINNYSFVIELKKKEYTKWINPYLYVHERNLKKYKATHKDIVWACFQNNYTKYTILQDWNFLIKLDFNSYLHLKEENHADAITFLLSAILISLSGLYFKNLLHRFSENIVPQKYISELSNYYSSMNISGIEPDLYLLNRFDEACRRVGFLPFSYFDKLDLEDIIFSMAETGKVNYSFLRVNDPDDNKFNFVSEPEI